MLRPTVYIPSGQTKLVPCPYIMELLLPASVYLPGAAREIAVAAPEW
jgi:hypothetical protein